MTVLITYSCRLKNAHISRFWANYMWHVFTFISCQTEVLNTLAHSSYFLTSNGPIELTYL